MRERKLYGRKGAGYAVFRWRATIAVTGADGLPPVSSAGNVLLPELALKISLRLPPTCDAGRAAQAGHARHAPKPAAA